MDMVAEDTAVAAILLDAAAKDIDINQSIIWYHVKHCMMYKYRVQIYRDELRTIYTV
jgi:hypothetical protein